jgi:ABC-type Na+ efflux pump permease subunit
MTAPRRRPRSLALEASTIGLIARREFLAAVANKGFVIGLLMMPVLFALFIIVTPFVFGPRSVEVRGQIAVIDTTGRVTGELQRVFDPEAMAARRKAEVERVLANAPGAARTLPGSAGALANMAGPVAEIEVIARPDGSDVEREKAWLLEPAPGERRLAVVKIHERAVEPPPGEPFGTYDLYVPAGMSADTESIIHDGLRDAIVSARVALQQLDRERVEALMRVPRARSVTVSATEERETIRGFNVVLPMVFAGLLLMGVMIGGQTLLTSTIEEKSSRVIEVLLSAVSPMELMAGKIFGQLAVSLLVLLVYAGLGLALLVSFALIGLLDPWLVVYLFVFFLITYALFASVFAAAGAAVTDLKEAQALMGPIMLVLMGPWFLAFPIVRDPDSPMAVVLSFVPPVNSFFMMLRLASTSPPPAWQALASIAIGVAAAWAAIWCAAKVFRIGLLMHGKPPNLRTLVRWVRMA